ncbi:MAG: glycosyltransferase family 4 protein [Devosia sp.]
MRVAIVTVRAASGEAGGAERFYDALTEAFRKAGHAAQEVPVVADESTFEQIKRNYLACYDLDLSAFDLVVSTKAPTWLVRHPRHVCYLVHTIRVFYDMFDTVFPNASPELHAQRGLVHRLDTEALSSPRCRRIFSIGSEVSKRLSEWNGLDAGVLHPPLWSDTFGAGPFGDYLLLPGRLHPWKRVDLVIRAMRLATAPLRLVITGTGEAESELRALAAGDTRVEFRGRVSDAELVDLYAGAYAVPFAPMREDYGYVTLEAFASGKPVITCNDSGEAAAIVRQSMAGYVCEPTPVAIGKHIDMLWQDRERAVALGRAGHAWVHALSWERIVGRLIDASL